MNAMRFLAIVRPNIRLVIALKYAEPGCRGSLLMLLSFC